LAATNKLAEALRQQATHAPQPIQVAVAKAETALTGQVVVHHSLFCRAKTGTFCFHISHPSKHCSTRLNGSVMPLRRVLLLLELMLKHFSTCRTQS